MTQKCYNKPNRSLPRYFKTCDVGRIAQQCARDTGATKQEIISCVAQALSIEKMALSFEDYDKDQVKQIGGSAGASLASEIPGAALFAGFVREVPKPAISFITKFIQWASRSNIGFALISLGLGALLNEANQYLESKRTFEQVNPLIDTKTLTRGKCNCNKGEYGFKQSIGSK